MIKMSWRDVVRKSPPLTPEEEKLVQEEMRFGNVDRKEAERRIRRKTGKVGQRKTEPMMTICVTTNRKSPITLI